MDAVKFMQLMSELVSFVPEWQHRSSFTDPHQRQIDEEAERLWSRFKVLILQESHEDG